MPSMGLIFHTDNDGLMVSSC